MIIHFQINAYFEKDVNVLSHPRVIYAASCKDRNLWLNYDVEQKSSCVYELRLAAIIRRLKYLFVAR